MRTPAIRPLVVAIAVALVLGGCSPVTRATYANPIVSVGQDPFMSQWHDRYLLTEQRNDDEIWIRESRPNDLTGIESHGSSHRVWAAPQTGNHCTDLWAPELHHIANRWYIYYAATTCDGDNTKHRMFVLESVTNDPLGKYRDRGMISTSPDGWAIDGTEFAWHGNRYFVWSGWPDRSGSEQDLFIASMSSPTKLSSKPVRIARPSLSWERHGAPIEEGPEFLSHAGHGFLVYSASGSWTDDYRYGLLSLTGSNPLDASSWKKTKSAVFSSAHGVFGPGHGSFVTSPDGSQFWMIYHSAIAEGSGWQRQVDAQQYSWRADGTPDFGSPTAEDNQLPVPSGQR